MNHKILLFKCQIVLDFSFPKEDERFCDNMKSFFSNFLSFENVINRIDSVFFDYFSSIFEEKSFTNLIADPTKGIDIISPLKSGAESKNHLPEVRSFAIDTTNTQISFEIFSHKKQWKLEEGTSFIVIKFQAFRLNPETDKLERLPLKRGFIQRLSR